MSAVVVVVVVVGPCPVVVECELLVPFPRHDLTELPIVAEATAVHDHACCRCPRLLPVPALSRRVLASVISISIIDNKSRPFFV